MPDRFALALEGLVREVVHHRLGDNGRFDVFTITEVDYLNYFAVADGAEGTEVLTFRPNLFPSVGQVWMAHRRPDGSYVLSGMITP